VLMNGNQTAVLAFNYLIEARKAKGIAQPNDMVVKTIVTSEMIDEIAKKSNITCYNVLTGFKWIAELIKEKEKNENYVIGGEESYGLMIGDKLRDKDAVSAVALLCEMAAYEKNKGKSLFEKLIDLYLQFGFYKEHLISITKKGMDGQKQIADMMSTYRDHPPTSIAVVDFRVTNPSDVIFEVRTVTVQMIGADGKTYDGQISSDSDADAVMKALPVLGEKYNKTLRVKDRIGAHGSEDRMAAVRFVAPLTELDARKNLTVRIEEVDGKSFTYSEH